VRVKCDLRLPCCIRIVFIRHKLIHSKHKSNKPQSRKRDCGLTCSVRRSRRAPAVEKGPSRRAHPLRKRHWTRCDRRRPTRSCCFRTSTSICHRTHRAAAYQYMRNLRPVHSTHRDGDPDIVNGLTAIDC